MSEPRSTTKQSTPIRWPTMTCPSGEAWPSDKGSRDKRRQAGLELYTKQMKDSSVRQFWTNLYLVIACEQGNLRQTWVAVGRTSHSSTVSQLAQGIKSNIGVEEGDRQRTLCAPIEPPRPTVIGCSVGDFAYLSEYNTTGFTVCTSSDTAKTHMHSISG